MIRKIIFSLGLLASTATLAQQGTASPYSFYGIGDINANATNEYKAMGGMSVYSDSIHLNLNNPASYSKLRLTTFALGTTFKNYSLQGNDAKETAKRASVDYLALGLPLGKAGISFGIAPNSATGYKIGTLTQIGNQEHSSQFSGDGGINKVFLGGGYAVLPNLHLGVDVGYHFGQINNSTKTYVTNNGDDYYIPNGTRETIRTDYTGFSYKIGALYEGTWKQYNWNLTASFSPETKWDASKLTKLEIINLNESVLDSRTLEDSDGKSINPSKFSLGTGIGKQHKWFAGVEYTHTAFSKFNATNTFQNATYQDGHRINLGGFYIPKYNSFTSYFDRIVYRAGFRYENTGLVLHQQDINDYAFSLGAGFPIGRNLTNLNIGLEYGQKGTHKNNLIKENYFNLSIGVSLNDLWFVKRKFE